MSNIKTIAIERITRQLDTLGCRYKVITEDGVEFGTLPVTDPSNGRTREHNRYVRETNYQEWLKKIKPGESVFIPAATAPIGGLQSACAAYMVTHYGKGTFMTVRHNERNGVEVLRLE